MNAATFDPYAQWLGISPHEQPVNYYRLLGVPNFESNPHTLAAAADARLGYLASMTATEYGAYAQQLYQEVAAVRAYLLDPAQKAQYDAFLMQQAGPQAVQPGVPQAVPASQGSSVMRGAGSSVSVGSPHVATIIAQAGGNVLPSQGSSISRGNGGSSISRGGVARAVPVVGPGSSVQAAVPGQPVGAIPQAGSAVHAQAGYGQQAYPQQPGYPPQAYPQPGQPQGSSVSAYGAYPQQQPGYPPPSGVQQAYPQQAGYPQPGYAPQAAEAAPQPANAFDALDSTRKPKPFDPTLPIVGAVAVILLVAGPTILASMNKKPDAAPPATVAKNDPAPATTKTTTPPAVKPPTVPTPPPANFAPPADFTPSKPVEPTKPEPTKPEGTKPDPEVSTPPVKPETPGEDPNAKPPIVRNPPKDPAVEETLGGKNEPGMENEKPGPVKPNTPGGDGMEAENPGEEGKAAEPTPQQNAAFLAAAKKVRSALGEREWAAADVDVRALLKAAVSEKQKDEAQRLQTCLSSAKQFWAAVDRTLEVLQAGEEFEFGDKVMVVVEAEKNKLIVRVTGKNYRWTNADMPTKVAVVMAQRGLDKPAAARLFIGAHYVIDKEGRDVLQARGSLDQAARSGDPAFKQNAEALLAEIDVKRPWE